MPWRSSVGGPTPGQAQYTSSVPSRVTVCRVGITEILFHRDSRPPHARRPARAPGRLRLARASRPVQGLGSRVRVELRQPPAAARRVLDPVWRRPADPADHRVGRAAVRDIPLCRSPPLDLLRNVAPDRGFGDPRECAARQKGADAAAALAGGERAVGARQLSSQLHRVAGDPRDLRAASSGGAAVGSAARRAPDRDEPWVRVSLERARRLLPRRAAHPRDPSARVVLPDTGALPGRRPERPARGAAPALPEPHDVAHRRVPARAARRTRAAVGRPRVLGGLRDRPLRRRLRLLRPREGRLRERPVVAQARAARRAARESRLDAEKKPRARPVARGVFWRELALVVVCVEIAIFILAFDPSVLNVFDLTKASFTHALAWGLLGALIVIALGDGFRVPLSPVFVAFYAVVAVEILTTFTAENQYVALYGEVGRYLGLTTHAVLALLAVAIAVSVDYPRRVSWLAWTIAAASTLAGVYAVQQALGLDPVQWIDFDPRIRPFSTFGNADFYGQFLAVVAVACGAVLVFLRQRLLVMGVGSLLPAFHVAPVLLVQTRRP